MVVLRPADANETRCAWQVAIERHDGPTTLVLTRQHVPTLDRRRYAPAEGCAAAPTCSTREQADPELILIATGSEVSLIAGAEALLRERGVRARIVSMPSWELFAAQSAEYRRERAARAVTARLAVEAGELDRLGAMGRDRTAMSLSVDRFGRSAPGEVVMREYGFTVDNVVARALALVGR